MRRTTLALLCLLAVACAQNRAYREGLDLVNAGNVEAGLAKLEEASRNEPRNSEYRQALIRNREVALQRYLALAESSRQQGQWDQAEVFYRRMAAIDPGNQRAAAGLAALATDRRHRTQLAQADELLKKGDSAGAQLAVRSVLAENPGNREAQQMLRRMEERALRAAAPALSAALRERVTLEFRDATLRQVFEAFSRSTGLNFIFDREVRQDLRATIFVRNSSVEDVMRFVLVSNQLERKVLSDNTILVYPNTPAKLRDYQDLVVKTFYLANTDAKSVATLIRQMVKTREVYIDEKLNFVVMRDTPDAVRMAERLVANHDLAEPEAMLEVEVLEVGSSALTEIGIRWPESVSYSLVGAAGIPGTVTLPEWLNRGSEMVRLTITNPFLAANFRAQLGRSNVLANPRIRVKNKDKARVHIGDKVPVITTTSTATGFASESVTYLDVGLKLDVEPTVFLDDEVGIKIALEVSNIAREIKSATSLTYQLGTRNASTTLRLKDGETQILAGLINDEDRRSVNQVPGLGDIPVLGRLFGSHLNNSTKTEIVLLITPRIVRSLARPEPAFEEFPSGTDSAIGAPPLLLQRTALEVPAVAAAAPKVAPPKVARVLLQAPAGVRAGQEFTLQVALDSAQAVRGGALEFAFDPSRIRFLAASPGTLTAAADKDATFTAGAPEGMGRLSLGFSSKADLRGQGELAVIRFQAMGAAAGTPTLRLDVLSLTDAAGQAIAAQAPPPVTVSLSP